MSRRQANRAGSFRGTRPAATLLGLLLTLLLTRAGLADRWTDMLKGFFSTGDPRKCLAEGEFTLHDGEETQVVYKTPFQSPPRLVLVECRHSWTNGKPYNRSDFEFTRQEGTFFKVKNRHPDPYPGGSYAVMRWQAVGVRAGPEDAIAAIQKLGGRVEADPNGLPGTVAGIDLQGTAAGDADLLWLRQLSGVRTLNLSGTRVTDLGMDCLTGLTNLQMLYLDNTAVTDGGLGQLRALKGLKQMTLFRTQVTAAGVQQFKQALPAVRVTGQPEGGNLILTGL